MSEKIAFVWEDFGNPKLEQLRKKYNLKSVAVGRDDFEKQIMLKKWVFNKLKLGYKNRKQYDSALEVLDDADKGEEFNCTWYVLVYLQCAQAMGWYVRKLGIDSDHEFGEEEMRHTVVDVWSDKFKKWYVIDPMFNAHFENVGRPLNAYEIRNKCLSGDEKKVERIFGNYQREELSDKVKERFDDPRNYYWFFVLLRNNYFENSDVYDSKALLWVDEYNRDKKWYVGGRQKGEFREHPMYQGAFVKTGDLGLLYPKMRNIV